MSKQPKTKDEEVILDLTKEPEAPQSFIDGVRDIQEGRVVDLDVALDEPPAEINNRPRPKAARP